MTAATPAALKVLLAIPAHNEEERIGGSLTAAIGSLALARQAGVISDGRIALAAHRCSDRTESVAREILGPDHLVQAGIHGTDRHDHVYAANLGMRSSYQRAGGFPDVRHGEEHALLAAVRSAGGRVLTSAELAVITSG